MTPATSGLSTRLGEPSGPNPQGSWPDMLDRTVGLCSAGLIAVWLVIAMTVLFEDLWLWRRPEFWVAIVSQAGLIGFYATSAVRRLTVPIISAAIAAGVIGVGSALGLAILQAPSIASSSAHVLQAVTVQGLQFVAVLFVTRVVLAAALVGIVPLAVVVLGWNVTPAIGIEIAHAVVPSSVFASSCLILVHAFRRDALEAEQVSCRRRRARIDAALGARAELAEAEGRRVLHDRVIGALGMVEAGTDRAAASEACRVALAALSTSDSVASGEALLGELMQKEGIRVRRVGGSWDFAPPIGVITAMRESAGEAIRNARRHAGVDEVCVGLSSQYRGQITVTVNDGGPGFDPSVRAGFGLSQSIAARMKQVGGEATIASAPGAGTTVILRWPSSPTYAIPQAHGVFGRGSRARLYFLLVAPPIVALACLALGYPPVAGQRGGSVALAAMFAAILLICARSIGRSRPGWALIVVVMVLLVSASGAVLSMSRAQALETSDLWVVFASAVVIGLLALEATWQQAAALVVAELGAVWAWAVHSHDLRAVESVSALVLPLTYAGASFVAGALLRRGSAALRAQEALAIVRIEEQNWLESGRAARRRIVGQLRSDVMPFLERCALEGPEPTPQVRAEAAALAAQCRDLLTHVDGLPAASQAAVLAARRAGMSVNIRGASTAQAGAWQLLRSVLSRVPDADAVTLVPSQYGSHLRVSVLPPVDDSRVSQIRLDLAQERVEVEATDVSTTFILVSSEAVTSGPDSGPSWIRA